MSTLPAFVKSLSTPVYPYRYSVCTLVTRRNEYLQMLDSFLTAGFDNESCEYLAIDNSQSNLLDAYDGINRFLHEARGEYIIICHQDILLTDTSTRQTLEQRISGMDALDLNWAILGNAGAADRLYDRLAIHIAYPDGSIVKKGTLPQKVASVDENFFVVKNTANLSLSRDIGGYHLYGLDLCHVAEALGYTTYVIDFLLIHKSRGNVDASFHSALYKVKKKYARLMASRYINTTIAKFYLSGSGLKTGFYDNRVVRRILKTAEEIKHKISNR